MKKIVSLLSLLLLLTACSTPQRGSEEYWFNKLLDEQRAQCSQLPEPLSTSCLTDLTKKNYQDFIRGKNDKTLNK
jgi:Tfp pilus assembly protein PilP